MFKRRIPLSVGSRVWRLVWPRLGVKRTALYQWHRLRRLPGTASAIAAGFACGAAVSFLPLNGLHFLLAAFLAWLMRVSVVASAFGTIIGNPWTFPPIWMGIYCLGQVILGQGACAGQRLDFAQMFEALWYGLSRLDGAYIADHVWPLWWPMMVGGMPVAIFVWVGFYWLLKRAITRYEKGRRRLQRSQPLDDLSRQDFSRGKSSFEAGSQDLRGETSDFGHRQRSDGYETNRTGH